MRSTMLMATLASGMLASASWAQVMPSGGKITAGTAGIATSGTTTTITQTSGKSIIDWQSFSIGQGGTVQFNNGTGATLNRVTGGNLSSIDGLLSATGSVYLINPNGVIIDKTGVVKTGGGFVASTLDIDDNNFLNGGDQTLAGSSLASVVNLGRIGALGGDVALVAANVRNDGTVVVPNGALGLLAGNRVLMRDTAVNDGKFLVLSGGGATSVTNTGALEAASVELRAEGGNIYALAGNTTGVIRATGVSATDGHIFLTAGDTGSVTVSGSTLKASNSAGNGGTISVTGGQISVASDATFDASAAAANGNGGSVSVIAELTSGTLDFQGAALARGGATGGNGGEVETSGHTVNFDGARIDTSAIGQSGTWRVDPDNLTVDSASAATIDSNLATTNVTLQTTSTTASGTGVSSSGSGDIIISSALSWLSANTLTLDAYHSIQINANVTVAGSGGVVLKTNDGGSGGDYTFALGNSLSLTGTGGSLTINGNAYTLLYSMSDVTGLNNASGHYALASSLTPSQSYTASVVTAFYGTFTGLGHTVNSLAITSSGQNNGLFGTVETGGTVRDIGLSGGTIRSNAGAGSLVGVNDGTIQYAYSSAAVISTANHDGGLVGINYGTITNSFATGAVSGTAGVGGLVGVSEAGSTIRDSYASGTVTASSSNSGGLLGTNDGAAIQYSYATGEVTLSSGGGLVGSQSSGTITNSYYDSATTGRGGSTGTSQTTSQLQGSLPTGFSTNVWATGTGLYPYLKSFYPNGVIAVSGIAYTSTHTAAGTASISLYTAGNLAGSANSGANGYYYIPIAGGTGGSTAGVTEALSGGSVTGAAYSDAANLTTSNISGLNVTSGAFNYSTGAASYATFLAGVTSAFGSTYYSTLQTTLASAPSTINASGNFTIDTGLGMAGTIVIKTLGGDLTVGSDLTLSGTTALTLDAYNNLNVDGNITASGTAVTLKTADGGSGDYAFALGKSLSFTGTGNALSINGQSYTLLTSMDGIAGMTTGHYALANDLTPGTSYSGSVVADFTGTFTGLGHAINNLVVTNANPGGLFALNEGTVRDLILSGGEIVGAGTTGALAGQNTGTIQNVYSSATVVGSPPISNATADVTAVGGLVGINDGTITNSVSVGNVLSSSFGSNNTSMIGGLVGQNASGGTITNAYAMGAVSGLNSVGGLIGENDGIATDVYSTGYVLSNGGSNINGLVGLQNGTTSGVYDVNTSGQTTGAGTGLATGDLQGALPSGFGAATWGTGSGLYPYLKTFYPNGVVPVTGTGFASAETLNLYSGGNLLSSGSVGANGYYYIATTAGVTGASAAITLTSTNVYGGAMSLDGLTYSDTLSNGRVTGFNIQGDEVSLNTGATTYSALQTGLSNTLGSAYTGIQSALVSASTTITGANAFSFDQAATFGGSLAVSATGGITLSNTLGAAGTTFNSAVTLAGNTTINAGSGTVTFNSTVDGGFGLTINTSGSTNLLNGVGTTTPLASLTTDAAGSTLLGGTIRTSGAQTYNDPARISANTILTSTTSGDIKFASTVNGAHTLTVNTSGATLFSSTVGATQNLTSLTTDAGGTTSLGGNVKTSGGQTFNDAVTLATDLTLTSTTSGAIDLASTLNGAHALTVNTTGVTTFGGTANLASLTTDAGGTTTLAGHITTSGLETFNDAVTLGANATLTAGGALTLNSTVNGAYSLAVSGASVTFNGVVGGTTHLASLSGTATGGDIDLNGQITTTGDIVLAANGDLVNTAGATALNTTANVTVYTQSASHPTSTLPSDTFDGLTATNYYNDAYDFTAGTFASAVPSGRHFVYAYQVSLTPTLSGSATKVYNGTDIASTSGLTIGYGSLLSGSDSVGFAIAGASFDTKNVGNSKTVTASGISLSSNPNNYTLTTTTAAAAVGSITPATLTLTAGTDTRTYNGTTVSGGTVGYSGLQTGDTLSGLTQAFDSKNVLGTGNSTLSVTGYSLSDGNNGGNYTVVTQTASGTINPATLTLTAGTDSRDYNGTTSSGGTVGYSGLQTGDTLTGLTQAFDSKNVMGAGNSTLSVTGYSLSDGNNGGNYTVVTQTASGTINPATLTLTASTDTRGYNGTTASSGTVGYSGLQTGDTLSGLTQTFASKNAGAEATNVTGYTLTDGNGGNNYIVDTVAGSGTIGKATLTLTAGTDSRTYDGGTDSSGTVSYSGLQTGDALTGLTQAFASKNAGTEATNVTGYTLTDGNGGNNYTVDIVAGSGTIAKATLTLTAGTDSRIYDGGTDSSGTVGYSGLQTGDNLSGLTQAFDSKNVLGAGNSTLSVTGYSLSDGNNGGNYTVVTQTASGTITPATLVAGLTGAVTKTYDATTSATLTAGDYTLAGVLGSDTVNLNDPTTGAYADKNAGSGKAVSVSGLALSGADAGNYVLSTSTASANIGTITPAGLTLAAVTDTKTYDATTTSAGTVAISGLQGSDTVTGDTQSFGSKNVLGAGGSTLSINEGYTVNDGNGGANYVVSTQTASGTITPAALTATLTGATSKTYDSSVSATLTAGNYVLTGVLGSDTVALNDPTSGAYADANAGTRKAVTVTGLALIGSDAGNYTVNGMATGTIDIITPAALTITANSLGKNAGATDPLLTYVLTSGALFGNDTLSGNLSRASGENPGAYTITQGTLAASSNYDVTFTPGVFTITQVALQNTPIANPVSNSTGTGQPVIQTSPIGLSSTSPTASDASSSTSSSAGGGAKDAASNAGNGDEKTTGPNIQAVIPSNNTCADGCSNTPYPANQYISSSISFSQ